MITGIITGMILMLLIKEYIKGRNTKKEREDLINKMNTWRQEKYNNKQ